VAPVLPTEDMAGAVPVVAGADMIVLMDNGAGMAPLVVDGEALEAVEETANDDVKDKAGMPYVVVEACDCDEAVTVATTGAADDVDDVEDADTVPAFEDPFANMELNERGAATAVPEEVVAAAVLLMEAGAALSEVKKLAIAALGGGAFLVADAAQHNPCKNPIRGWETTINTRITRKHNASETSADANKQ
jgi:hypothetical protein